MSEAKKSGYSNGNEIIVCGPLKYLLTDVNSTDSKLRNYKHSFGIALSGPSFLQTNDELVSYGKIIQNRFNLDMYVRPHPALSQDYIDSLLSETKYSISKGSMVEFANECNFVILGNTNTFADLIALGVPTFRMISSDGLDFFEEISDLKFTNEKELLNQVTLVGDDELNIIIEKWSDFVCPKWDIRERYISTFNKIMNKGDNSK